MERLAKLGNRALENLVIGLFGVLCVFVFSEVIARYAFNRPHAWSEEATIYLFTWISFLGAVLALKNDRHVAISFCVAKLPARWQALCSLLAHALTLVFLILLFVQSVRFTEMSSTVNSIVLQIPLSWVSVSLVVMAGLMGLCLVERVVQSLRRIARADAPASSRGDRRC